MISGLAFCATAAPPPAAPPGGLDGPVEKPRALLGELARTHLPFAVGVAITNTSPKNRNCRVVVGEGLSNSPRISGETRMTLAPGSRHMITMLAPTCTYSQSLKVECPGISSSPAMLTAQPVNEMDLLALVLSPQGTEFAYLGGYKSLLSSGGEFRINHPSREGPLPGSWLAYLGSDLIVLYDFPRLNLGPEVQEALLQWTRVGGTLVVVSNLDLAEYRGSVLENYLPLESESVDRTQEAALLVGKPRPGTEAVYSSQGRTLAYGRRCSQGQIIQIAASVANQKLLGPDLTQELWASVLGARQEGAPFSRWRFKAGVRRIVRPAELPKPSAAGIAWYLVIYSLVLIPANYWYLRRKDRTLWLIVTLPILSTGITAISFAINSAQRGSETVIRESGIAFLDNHSQVAVADHGIMLFSPRSARFRIDFPKLGYLRPEDFDGYGFHNRDVHLVNDGDTLYFRDFQVPMWSLARFRNLSIKELAGPIDVTVTPQGKSFKLEVKNSTGLTLKGCRYFDGRQHCSQAFDVAPGVATVEADMRSNTVLREVLRTGPQGTVLQNEELESLGDGVRISSSACLLGWSDDPKMASGVHIDSKAKYLPETMVVVPIESKIALARGKKKKK